MIKVLIADSDIDNIGHFRSYIRKNYDSFEIVKTAISLKELNKYVESKKPNLIIADLDLFGISVIVALKDLNKKYPEMRFILYGNYSEEDYLKKCMEYGEICYMFKPVKPVELDKSLNEAILYFKEIENLDFERKKLINDYTDKIMLFEAKFLNNLIMGFSAGENEILDGMRYFNISIEKPYAVLIVRVDHFKKLVLAFDEREKHLFIFEILSIINEYINDDKKAKAFINHFNEIAVIFGEIYNFEQLLGIAREIKECIFKKISLSISIGIGRIYDNLHDIHVSYNEANAALRYRCFLGYNSIIPIDYVEPDNHITYRYPLNREELLVYTSVIGEYDYCVKLTNEIFDALKNCQGIHKRLLPQIVMDILISINRNAYEQGYEINGIKKFFEIDKMIKINNIDEIKKCFLEGLKKFCEYILVCRNEMEEKLVEEAAKYIECNFYENINAKKAADKLNCSDEYLKKLFKEKKGYSFIEYVSRVRIENAKEIIEKTDAEDEIAALKTGYRDIKEFKAVFRKVTGYTTSEFRARIRKEKDKIRKGQ